MNSDAEMLQAMEWGEGVSRGTPLRRIGSPLRPNGFGGVPLVERDSRNFVGA